MHRFPNPGSTIAIFIAVYAAAFERLEGRVVDLDDMVGAVVDANLATSAGHMGQEAILRSTRADRSRDGLYNLLKMYAELYRSLGWLHPTAESSLNYNFTLLGQQLIAASPNFLPLFRECALGMVNPSHVLRTTRKYELRPIAFILQTMLDADGYLSRDEMILGPLNAASDRPANAAMAVGRYVKNLRKSAATVSRELANLANLRDVQVRTLHNYTRWPLAALQYCGWARHDSVTYEDGVRYQALAITDEGKATVQRLSGMNDLRLDQLDQLPNDEKSALSTEAHYAMLGRAGFDLAPVTEMLESDHPRVVSGLERLKLSPDRDLLLSPFQTLSIADIEAAFPNSNLPSDKAQQEEKQIDGDRPTGRGSRDHLFVAPILVNLQGIARATPGGSPLDADAVAVKAELSELLNEHGTIENAAEILAQQHAADTKAEFYPFVTHLFQIVGYSSEHSRVGVNYQRWDACVWLGKQALPVEIKSPTEEEYLSTKSLRQAIENKVVLLSRGGIETTRDLTSLIVGFKVPNERGELSTLIDDIFKTYGFRVGVIDLKSLARLALRSVAQGLTIDQKQLGSLLGFLDV